MAPIHNIRIQEENELQKIVEQILRKYHWFVIGIGTALVLATIINFFSTPIYKVKTVINIISNEQKQPMGDYVSSSLYGTGNLEKELLTLQSSPLISQVINSLDLLVNYYEKDMFRMKDKYKKVPFRIMYMRNHVQPIGSMFKITFTSNNEFEITSDSKMVGLYNYEMQKFTGQKEEWTYKQKGKIGQLIETPDASFMVELDSIQMDHLKDNKEYYFSFNDSQSMTALLANQVEISVIDSKSNVLEIVLRTSSVQKGIDILNAITNVYSKDNLEKKNHLAAITIDYIDKQLNEISDSLSQTEQTLQRFRSSKQLLSINQQSSDISSQYRNIQNQRGELSSKIRYYQSIVDLFSNSDDYSNIAVPASMGIQDPLLNGLMSQLLTIQTQKNEMLKSGTVNNPMLKKYEGQINVLKKNITENINYVMKTAEISLDDLDKRMNGIEAEISRMPETEIKLSGIERKYKLNDAIITFLMQKRAEAKITRASNLPDNEIIEPARMDGFGPSFPNKKLNYIIALVMGFVIPFLYLQFSNILNTKIDSIDQIEKTTDVPVLGKIMHNNRKTNNVLYEFPNSSIAEGYRALRTNLDYYVRGGHKKVIMVTSCIEGEGKSFNALNIAMSYAQFNKKTILIDFDLRKISSYFSKSNDNLIGLSSYLINKAVMEDIIINSPHSNLDYIPSGPIPPNPVELIGLEKTEKLIDILKESYDYIILDTPPLAQVTDGYLLIDKADIKIIVTRYNYSIKNIFSVIMKDLRQKNINNLCIVYNDNRTFHGDRYGNYGYHNDDSKKKKKSLKS